MERNWTASVRDRPARLGAALALAAVLGLSACATPGYGPATTGGTYGSAYRCDECGVIQGITVEQRQPDGSIALGAVIDGVAGTAGRAYADQKTEQAQKAKTVYKFTVRMNDGSFTTVTQDSNPGLRVGDRVRIVSDRVLAR